MFKNVFGTSISGGCEQRGCATHKLVRVGQLAGVSRVYVGTAERILATADNGRSAVRGSIRAEVTGHRKGRTRR
eukprot:1631932-Pleurochrysis_carterae.AAC.1